MLKFLLPTFGVALGLEGGLLGPFTQESAPNNPTSADCDWKWFNQPLNHFSGVSNADNFVFKQRTCFYDKFWKTKPSAVLFYVGNESPLEIYVNNTGMMWNLAHELKAGIIFAEHRYEGLSVPSVLDNTENCMAYASSKQALADYALLIETLKFTSPYKEIYGDVPFIAFGGSYGGMLAGWIRTKYPHLIAGALAGSAPIFGVPMLNNRFFQTGKHSVNSAQQQLTESHRKKKKSFNSILDSSSMFISRSLTKAGGLSGSTCMLNFKAFWILLKYAMEQSDVVGLNEKIADSMRLCSVPASSAADYYLLSDFMQSAFFLLAEGNYPFPSAYITGAVGGNMNVKLPAWPMHHACKPMEEVSFPTGETGSMISLEENLQSGSTMQEPFDNAAPLVAPNYTLTFGDLQLNVVGENVNKVGGSLDGPSFLKLAKAAAEGVEVWYNFTGQEQCLNWKEPAPNSDTTVASGTSATDAQEALSQGEQNGQRQPSSLMRQSKMPRVSHLHTKGQTKRELYSGATMGRNVFLPALGARDDGASNDDPQPTSSRTCSYASSNVVPPAFSWGPTVCNDQMFLVNTDSMGYGRDAFFPPSGPASLQDMYGTLTMSPLNIISANSSTVLTSECAADSNAQKLFGLTDRADPYGQEMFDYYGPLKDTASKIIFSNGLLDPWSGGGIGLPGVDGFMVDDLGAETVYPDPEKYDPKKNPVEYTQQLFYPIDERIAKNAQDRELFAAIVSHGAHHLDLMYPCDDDPVDVKFVRREEVKWIKKWIADHNREHAEEQATGEDVIYDL
uniref:Uncharacterized protein n=1 Tax=Noctiluca scintillans TaxID=2966 RepID=A0A7S0ZZS3_NOCSC|mmetsp:Transcript_26020/g.68310  ORF Transcript_26020/g.68310 Transcript_26020/m.68310 type:complete len:788 (+) Transcript_26020:39-2402(+)